MACNARRPPTEKQQTAVNNESGTEDEPRPEPRGATLGNRVYLTAGGGGSAVFHKILRKQGRP